MEILTDSVSVDSLKVIIDQQRKILNSLKETNTNQGWSLLLEYIKVFVWPSVVVYILFRYHQQVKNLFERVIRDSEEIKSSFLGISAKLRSEFSEITDSGTVNADVKQEIKGKLDRITEEEFRGLSAIFFTGNFKERRRTANEIAILSKNISYERLLNFATSSVPGERVAGFIGVRGKIYEMEYSQISQQLKDVLSSGLDDPYSRVRFRAIQAIGSKKELVKEFKETLIDHLEDETNKPTQKEIHHVLRKAD